MNLPKIVVSNKTSSEFTGDMIVAFVSLDKKEKFVCDENIRLVLKQFMNTSDFNGKSEEQLLLYSPFFSGKKFLQAKRLLLVGLGKNSGKNKPAVIFEKLRVAGGNIAKTAKKNK